MFPFQNKILEGDISFVKIIFPSGLSDFAVMGKPFVEAEMRVHHRPQVWKSFINPENYTGNSVER